MRITKLENIEQVTNLQVGDIIPMLDESSYIDGNFDGMLTEREEDTMIFLGRNPYEKDSWFRYLIPDVSKNGWINDIIGRYLFDGFNVAFIESIEENDPEHKEFIIKYREEIEK